MPRPQPERGRRGLHRFAVATAVATLGLIGAGGLVTSTESGLSVPDWPLSYGMVMPPMVGGVFYEHGHRMVATLVGAMTLVLAVWLSRREPRAFVRRLGWAALATVILQGVLGGLTVLYLLPTPISVAHACLAQAFLCLTVVLAVVTSPSWRAGDRQAAPNPLARSAAIAAAAIYVQLLLGAVMRHTKAGLAIPDFPLALGRIVPPLSTFPVAIHYAHRVWALVVAGFVIAAAVRARRSGRPGAGRVGAALGVLLLLQIALGAATVLTGKAVAVTTLHVVTGAALLATAVALMVGSLRRRVPETSLESAPSTSSRLARAGAA
jgi:cytochrome c oxidase assembly protein subunit 15